MTAGCITDKVVEFNSCYTLVDARYNLLGDGSCINMLWIEAIAQSRDTSCDLVELHAFFTSVCENLSVVCLEVHPTRPESNIATGSVRGQGEISPRLKTNMVVIQVYSAGGGSMMKESGKENNRGSRDQGRPHSPLSRAKELL